MSDLQQPVEETPSTIPTTTEPTAPAHTTPAATEPTHDAIESTPADTATDVPAPVKEETVAKDETKIEASPASEGVLGYKAPGLIKSFRFKKYFFWFSDDAVEHKHLHGYINNEKPDVAHPTAAWATQSGKGLLFYAKRAEDKSTPVGIINLAEISDVTKDGFSEFFFKIHTHKHTFEAATGAERASWMVAIETKATEAKGMKEAVVGSEGYKSQLEKYAKPAAVAAPIPHTTPKTETSTPKKSTEDKIKDVVKKDKPDSADSSDNEQKRKDKSRSQSRKRGSIFGTLLGKKEEHEEKKEIKKEEKAEAREEKKIEDEETHHVAPVAATEPSTAESAAIAAGAAPLAAEEKKPEETTDKTEAKAAEPTPLKSKRNSIFGGLFQKKEVTSPTTEKTKEEVAPAVPAKDIETPVEPVAETAPQIEAPVDSGKPLEAETVTKPIDAVSTPAPEETTTKPHEAGTSPSKGGLMGFFKKAENLFEEKTSPKHEHKAEKKVEEPAAGPTTTDAPAAITEPSTTPSAPTTEPSTTTPTAAPVKEKRRTSLFGSLGTMKKKTADKETSDTEGTDGEPKQKSTPTSPLPKLGSLFRKPSKAYKSPEKEATPGDSETATTPEPISKEEPTEPATRMTNGEGPKESIGDVVPEAVNVGHSTTPQVQAAA